MLGGAAHPLGAAGTVFQLGGGEQEREGIASQARDVVHIPHVRFEQLGGHAERQAGCFFPALANGVGKTVDLHQHQAERRLVPLPLGQAADQVVDEGRLAGDIDGRGAADLFGHFPRVVRPLNPEQFGKVVLGG